MSNIWRFTGPPENWITGLTRGFWALNEHNRSRWDDIQDGDIALFHSTAKSDYSRKVNSSIVGYATIGKRKFIKNELWWIQEINTKQLMWPYVFSLDKIYLFSDQLNIDFKTLIENKSALQITQEVESLSASGIALSDLQERARALNAEVPAFPVNGSSSRVNAIYEDLILHSDREFFPLNLEAHDFHEIEERYAETLDDELAKLSKDQLLAEGAAYSSSGPSHVVVQRQVKMRRENARQKRLVARLEDYTCQVCGFSCKYKDASGRERWIIEIYHIIPKADGTGEEFSNLWALCPNCHEKKNSRSYRY